MTELTSIYISTLMIDMYILGCLRDWVRNITPPSENLRPRSVPRPPVGLDCPLPLWPKGLLAQLAITVDISHPRSTLPIGLFGLPLQRKQTDLSGLLSTRRLIDRLSYQM